MERKYQPGPVMEKAMTTDVYLLSANAIAENTGELLNIDGKGRSSPETVVAKNARPSVLEGLRRPVPPRTADKKTKTHEEVR